VHLINLPFYQSPVELFSKLEFSNEFSFQFFGKEFFEATQKRNLKDRIFTYRSKINPTNFEEASFGVSKYSCQP
jgi:hypothetical protein